MSAPQGAELGEVGVDVDGRGRRAGTAPLAGSLSSRPAAASTMGSGIGSGQGAGQRPQAHGRTAAASYRSAGSGAAAHTSTSLRGPRASCSGSRVPTRAIRVATVVSPMNGASPVTAFVEDQGQGVDVGLAVEHPPFDLFGGRVAGGAQDGPVRLGPRRLGQGAGQAEVGDAQPPVGVEEEVGRLDVPVDQAPSVGVVEPGGGLDAHLDRLLRE